MKKILPAVLCMIVTSSSFASMTLEWSTNLNDIASANWQNAEIKEFSDESVAVMSFAAPNQLLVFNKTGSLLFTDEIEGDSLGYGAMFAGDTKESSRFFVENNVYTNDINYKNLFIYEKSGDTYVSSKIMSSNSTYSVRHDSGNRAKHLYIIEGSVLQKYQLSSSPTFLSGTSAMGISNSNFVITWNTEPDALYQIQSSSNLTNWHNIGSPLSGTGTPLTWSSSLNQSNLFFRITTE